MVVLDRADWLAWLDLTRPEAELLRPRYPPARWLSSKSGRQAAAAFPSVIGGPGSDFTVAALRLGNGLPGGLGLGLGPLLPVRRRHLVRQLDQSHPLRKTIATECTSGPPLQ
jgi:hypothetical protein